MQTRYKAAKLGDKLNIIVCSEKMPVDALQATMITSSLTIAKDHAEATAPSQAGATHARARRGEREQGSLMAVQHSSRYRLTCSFCRRMASSFSLTSRCFCEHRHTRLTCTPNAQAVLATGHAHNGKHRCTLGMPALLDHALPGLILMTAILQWHRHSEQA